MKKSILYSVLITLQGVVFAQGNPYSSCVTARKVCGATRAYSNDLPQSACTENLQPQYFKFDMIGSGNIQMNSDLHTGTYTLYGPLSSTGISGCEQIALGQTGRINGNLGGTTNIPHGEGYYILRVNPANCVATGDGYGVNIFLNTLNVNCKQVSSCEDCIGSFSPDPGNYLISAWVKGESQNRNTSYANPKIRVSFNGAPGSFDFSPSGVIIDEWQRIDGVVTIPAAATGIEVGLYCLSGDCLFDDIRFVPVNGSMISYVYDPVNLRLVAELDERNYATFYEYDEEGKLIRTKKETERGTMTIKENRDNIRKR